MNHPNIIFTGFMGTGKTTIGRLLAERTGRDFIDTDQIIISREGRTIAEIFHEKGEASFRDMERLIAIELAGQRNLVIATGGMLMLDPLNALLLGWHNIVICLTATPDEIVARLGGEVERRPLLEVPNPRERVSDLLKGRVEGYRRFYQVSTSNKTPENIVLEIETLINKLVQSGEYRQPFMSHIPVHYPGGEYVITVGHGLLEKLKDLIDFSGSLAIITDDKVGPNYLDRLGYLNPLAIITLPVGEAHKNLDTVRMIYDQLLAVGFDRQGLILALGGGVVGDMAGFAAATYMRGVYFIQCPTTVLAMVDASVGGKTGVDLPQGKNLVGAFKQPLAVIADLDTLKSLPAAEISAGMAEVVKHGLLVKSSLFETIEQISKKSQVNFIDLVLQSPTTSYHSGKPTLQSLIVEAILVKRDVIEADPYESGRRKILNLGHTFAHAIERVSNYRVRHGEAVAMGLVAAANLSSALGYCLPNLQHRLSLVIEGLGLPNTIPAHLSVDEMLKAMGSDKKKSAGRLQFILIRDIGDVFISDQVPEASIRQVISELQST